MSSEVVLGLTESVCPVCLARIPAQRVQRGEDVYLRKTCAEHGAFETRVWSGPPDYRDWQRAKIPAYPENPATCVERGCPYDCGLCPDHRQQPCCVLFEVTQACDLGCPVCFAGSRAADPPDFSADPGLETIAGWYQTLLDAGGPFNIQLSGGEPCLRDDLPEIISLGKRHGFTFFQVNTNGRRLARDPRFLERLVEAGLSTVYLQFDGVSPEVYQRIRGRDLLAEKVRAIENCLAAHVGVVLVPTLVPGVNTGELGEILRFALRYHPGVRGVHFQPISYFGRYPGVPEDAARITLPQIIRGLEEQSGGLVRAAAFKPSGGSHAACAFQGNFVVMPDGRLIPTTRFTPANGCCPAEPAQQNRVRAQSFVARAWQAPKNVSLLPEAPPAASAASPTGFNLGEWEVVLQRSQTHLLAISGMAFQDAWTLDLERLRECYIMVVAPDGRLVPFCAYNLTSREGQALYRACPPVPAAAPR